VNPTGHASWNAKDLKVQIQIATTLCKGPLNLIMQATSTKDCWDKLIARYQGKGGCHVTYLMESFFHTPLTDMEPMEPQIQKLIEADQNLQMIGCGVNDKNLTYIIIMALLDSLSTLQTILYNKDDKSITSEEVIVLILADEECHIHSSGRTAMAYYAKTGKWKSNSKSKGKDKDKDKKWCTYYTFRGHKAQKCQKKKRDKEKKAASKAASSGSKFSTSGGSSGSSSISTIKANVTIAKDNVIQILDSDPDPDPNDDDTKIHCALASCISNDSDMADK
jgi:hypothetical protein